MDLDPRALDKAGAYRLLISLLVPRPIAWVGTVSAAGIDNLAPFSYFMGVSSAPLRVAFSVARGRGGALKDTARNLLETGELTLAIVERPQLEAMHATGGAWRESEFDAVGVARGPSVTVRAPSVRDARVRLEGRVEHALDLGQVHLFVAEIVHVHVADELWEDGAVRLDGYEPMARLGGDAYAALGEILSLPPVRVP